MQKLPWEAEATWLEKEKSLRYTVRQHGAELTFQQVVQLWQTSDAFQQYFNDLLAGQSFSAFRWETPCVTSQTIGQKFEFVVVNSPGLARPVDSRAFENQFRQSAAGSVIAFQNLSGSSTMIVPTPPEDRDSLHAYGHLAAFVRDTPSSQQRELWQAIGDAMSEQISTKPLWLSTAGAGVSWLHVRLDPRPKYYHHGPYREGPGNTA